jgi:hypothetical protein
MVIKLLLFDIDKPGPAIVKKASTAVDCVKPGGYTFNFENFSTRDASYLPS